MTESKLREQVAKPIPCRSICVNYDKCKPFVNPVACTKKKLKPYILSLIKEELEGLTVIGDEELKECIKEDVSKSKHARYNIPIFLTPRDTITRKAQLSHTIKELKDKLGGNQ